MKLTKQERSFVDTARVARVATVDAGGVPHNVPICPLLHGERIYFATETESKKARNVAAHPQAAITFDDYTEAWEYLRGIMIVGQARVVKPAEFRRIRKKLYAKYPVYRSMAPIEHGESVIVEIVPRRKATWGFK